MTLSIPIPYLRLSMYLESQFVPLKMGTRWYKYHQVPLLLQGHRCVISHTLETPAQTYGDLLGDIPGVPTPYQSPSQAMASLIVPSLMRAHAHMHCIYIYIYMSYHKSRQFMLDQD